MSNANKDVPPPLPTLRRISEQLFDGPQLQDQNSTGYLLPEKDDNANQRAHSTPRGTECVSIMSDTDLDSGDVIDPYFPRLDQGGRYAYFDEAIDRADDDRAANRFEQEMVRQREDIAHQNEQEFGMFKARSPGDDPASSVDGLSG